MSYFQIIRTISQLFNQLATSFCQQSSCSFHIATNLQPQNSLSTNCPRHSIFARVFQIYNNCKRTIIELMLPTIVILAFLSKTSLQGTKSVANPYLGSFRSGYVSLPMTTANFTDQTFTATYSSQLANSSALQCYAFLSSFQIKFNGTYLNQTISVSDCSSSAVSISSSSFGTLSQTVAYLIVCNTLVGSPNFMVLQLYSINTSAVASLNNLNVTGQVKFFNFMVYTFFNICTNRTNQDQVGYGLQFVVNKYNSTSLNYSIVFQGNSKSNSSCFFSCGFRCLVIIMNMGYFSYGDTIMISGSARSYSNLKNLQITNVLGSNSSVLYTLAGLSGFYLKGGGSQVNFYYQEKPNGLISISTTIEENFMYFNYVTFPAQITEQADDSQNNSNTNNNTNNGTNNNNNTNNGTNNNTNNNTTPSNSSSNNGSQTEQAGFISLGKVMVISACAVVVMVVIITVICCYCRKPEIVLQAHPPNDEPATTNKLITSNIFSQQPKIQRQTCCICNFQGIEITSHCLHFFHIKCLKQHLSQSQICFFCKKSLKNDSFAALCVKCTKVQELTLQEVKSLGFGAQNQMLCKACEGKSEDKEIKTQQFEQVWLQYGIILTDQVISG